MFSRIRRTLYVLINSQAALYVIPALLIVMTALYIYGLYAAQHNDLQAYVLQATQQSAHILDKQIEGDLQALTSLAVFIESMRLYDVDHIIEVLNRENQYTSFHNMGIITPDGLAKSTNNIFYNAADRDYFMRALNGESLLSDTVFSKTDGKRINVYAVPIYKENAVFAILFSTQLASEFKDHLQLSLFDEKGVVFIINKNAQIMVNPDIKGMITDFASFSDIFPNTPHKASLEADIKTLLNRGTEETIRYTGTPTPLYMSFVPLEYNQWYAVSLVPQDMIAQQSTAFLKITCVIALCVIIFIAFLLRFISKSQHNYKKNIENLAYYDRLTGVYNWNGLCKEAEHLFRTHPYQVYVLIQIDLIHFRAINEQYGYTEGDRVLHTICTYICKHVIGKSLCARVSGSKLMILMPFSSEQETTQRIDSLMHGAVSFDETFTVRHEITYHFGAFVLPTDSYDFKTARDRTTAALNEVKNSVTEHNYGRFFDQAMSTQLHNEKEIECSMKKALQNREFVIYMQPKYELQGETIAGSEALVRWMKPGKGLISPAAFIPLFERNGFILNIDFYVLEETCKKIRQWLNADVQVPIVSVNMSRLHLKNNSFVTIVKQILDNYNVPPYYIEIELTESVFFDNIETMQKVSAQFIALGFSVSIDDFGSGYSSLNLLKDLTVTTLKLDKEFFDASEKDRRAHIIVSSIMQMAKSLHMKTVSEGVETKVQVDFLKKIGCDMVQGYYFAKPMPISDFEHIAFGKTITTEKEY